ncbi:pentatricopeptide repeat-containing protein At2g36980, mitochondrial [Typha angustifolia]|uniref:pentatricopeptide repeat-containing protein At2g36980, mitochondrial n=1 Tax=Typha angustifolia TaxID=59011 RepID=UPI003C307A84
MCLKAPIKCVRSIVNLRFTRPGIISATSRIVYLARSGLLSSARKLFDEMPERDTIAWNAMLTSYSHSGYSRDALSLFSRMRFCSERPDAFSFTAAIAASANIHDLGTGRMLHALLVHVGFQASLPVANSLVDMYAKCECPSDAALVFGEMEKRNDLSWCSLLYAYVNSGQFDSALKLFDEMSTRSTVAWNILIKGYAQIGDSELCLELFKEMWILGFEADDATYVIIMNACSELLEPYFGCMIHAILIQRGHNAVVEVNNALLSFYAEFGFRDDALRIFESMKARTQVSWNAMINANMKFGNVQEALSLLQRAPETNNISWTSMIAGFVRNGNGEEALALFVDMTKNFIRPDDFTFGAVLHACAITAALRCGKMVHNCVIQSGFYSYVYVANGLVDMYAKCGDIQSSNKVFDNISRKDIVSWNSMLFGFALHGWATKALDLFKDMLSRKVEPDEVTFIGLLTACSHSGLLDQGKALFEMMELIHGVKPNADHVTCIIDMFARAGCLRDASKLLEKYSKMLGEGTNDLCESLLSACYVNKNVSIGRKVGEELVTVEPQNEVGYVMLSNLYCASGQWKQAERVRRVMVEQGVKKSPGCSWIEVGNMIRVFVSGSQNLNQVTDVYDIIGLLNYEMRSPSYICFSNKL